MNNNRDISLAYDLIKEKILMPSKHYLNIIEIINKVTSYNENQGKSLTLLDFGCGQGLLLKLLENYNYNLYGYDFSNELIELAIKNTTNAKIYNKLPENKKYDVIVLSEVLEHLQDPLSVLKDLKDKLNKGGFLILTVPNGDRFNLGLYLHKKNEFQPINDIMYTFSEISLFLKLCSFRMLYWEGIGPIFRRSNTNNILIKIINKFLYPFLEKIFKAFGLFYLRTKQLIIVSQVDENISLRIN